MEMEKPNVHTVSGDIYCQGLGAASPSLAAALQVCQYSVLADVWGMERIHASSRAPGGAAFSLLSFC